MQQARDRETNHEDTKGETVVNFRIKKPALITSSTGCITVVCRTIGNRVVIKNSAKVWTDLEYFGRPTLYVGLSSQNYQSCLPSNIMTLGTSIYTVHV